MARAPAHLRRSYRVATDKGEREGRDAQMTARIYRPAKSAMTSGRGNSRHWVLEFDPADRRQLDPVMGWTSSSDTRRQLRLRFDTQDEAVAYAQRHKLAYRLEPERPRRRHLKAYADNFK